jgi:hypothetical protein
MEKQFLYGVSCISPSTQHAQEQYIYGINRIKNMGNSIKDTVEGITGTYMDKPMDLVIPTLASTATIATIAYAAYRIVRGG